MRDQKLGIRAKMSTIPLPRGAHNVIGSLGLLFPLVVVLAVRSNAERWTVSWPFLLGFAALCLLGPGYERRLMRARSSIGITPKSPGKQDLLQGVSLLATIGPLALLPFDQPWAAAVGVLCLLALAGYSWHQSLWAYDPVLTWRGYRVWEVETKQESLRVISRDRRVLPKRNLVVYASADQSHLAAGGHGRAQS